MREAISLVDKPLDYNQLMWLNLCNVFLTPDLSVLTKSPVQSSPWIAGMDPVKMVQRNGQSALRWA